MLLFSYFHDFGLSRFLSAERIEEYDPPRVIQPPACAWGPPPSSFNTWDIPSVRNMPSRQFGQLMDNLSGSPLPDTVPGKISSLNFRIPQWQTRFIYECVM